MKNYFTLVFILISGAVHAFTTEVDNNAVVNDETITMSETQKIISGTANNTTINMGGEQIVYSGGTSNDTTVNVRDIGGIQGKNRRFC